MGDLHVDALEVVLPAARKADEPVAVSAGGGHVYPEVAGKVAPPRERRLVRGDDFGCSFRNNIAAVEPGPGGAHVHDPVGAPDRLLVVLDHDEGVAEVAEVLQGLEEFSIVPLVQPDGGFVEDVENPR